MASRFNANQVAQIVEKLQQLPQERLDEIEDFIDFLRLRTADRQLTQAAMRLSENSFQRIWDNPDDAAYDTL